MISLHDDNIRAKIRSRYLDGKEIGEIMTELGISIGTWDSAMWRNTQGLGDFYENLKQLRFLRKIEQESKKIIEIDIDDEPKKLAVKQKEMEFVRETLLKNYGYTKRVESVGVSINTDPLDDTQKARLDNLLNKTIPVNGSTEPQNN